MVSFPKVLGMSKSTCTIAIACEQIVHLTSNRYRGVNESPKFWTGFICFVSSQSWFMWMDLYSAMVEFSMSDYIELLGKV